MKIILRLIKQVINCQFYKFFNEIKKSTEKSGHFCYKIVKSGHSIVQFETNILPVQEAKNWDCSAKIWTVGSPVGAKPQPKMCTFYLGLASLIFEFLILKYENFSPE